MTLEGELEQPRGRARARAQDLSAGRPRPTTPDRQPGRDHVALSRLLAGSRLPLRARAGARARSPPPRSSFAGDARQPFARRARRPSAAGWAPAAWRPRLRATPRPWAGPRPAAASPGP